MAGNSAFLSSGDGYLRKLLGFHKGFQVPFRDPRGNVGFLGKRCSVKGPHLTLRGEFCVFLWSCGRKLRVPLELCGGLGDPLVFPQEVRSAFELRGEPWDSSHVTAGMSRASSRVEAGTTVFRPSAHMDLRDLMDAQQGSQASFCVEKWNSASLFR